MIKSVLHRFRNGKAAVSGPHQPELRANRLRELLRNGQDFDILLINVRDFPLLRELYGNDLSQEVEAQLTTVLRRAVNERLHVVPFCMTLEPGEYLLGWPSQGADPRAQHDTAYEIRLLAQREAIADAIEALQHVLGQDGSGQQARP